MKINLPTSTFLELASETADWLMLVDLGQKKYNNLLIKSDGVEMFNDKGQNIYNDWPDDAEAFLLNYFERDE